MGKVFDLEAGKRTRVLWIFSSSIPGKVRFTAETASGTPPRGTIELVRRRGFSWQTTEQPLAPLNVFDKGVSDADYRIHVTPDEDCRVTFETRHFRAGILFSILAGVLLLGIVAGLGSFILNAVAPPK